MILFIKGKFKMVEVLNVKKWLKQDSCKLVKDNLIGGMESPDWFDQFIVWDIRKEQDKPCIALSDDDLDLLVRFLGHHLGADDGYIRDQLFHLIDLDQEFFSRYLDQADDDDDRGYTVISTPYIKSWTHLYKNILLTKKFFINEVQNLMESKTSFDAALSSFGAEDFMFPDPKKTYLEYREKFFHSIDRVITSSQRQIEEVFVFNEVLLTDVKDQMPDNLKGLMV